MVEIEKLNVFYAEKQVLKNIDLKIKDGECVVLTGESGCGKTTILNSINGILEKFTNAIIKGSVKINDTDWKSKQMYEIAMLVSSVFQNPKTHFFNINTTQELLFFLENIGLDRSEMDKRLNKMLRIFPIKYLLNRNIFDLSGGEKQVLSLASSYISGCKILLLDEPTSNLDRKYIDILQNMLKILKKKNISLIIAEHRLYYLMDIFDRLVYIKDGEIKKIYSKEEFLQFSTDDLHNMGVRSIADEKLKVNSITNDGELYIENLNCQFTKNKKLEIKNLHFKNGFVYGIIGANGCGKSTFIKSLIGVMKKSKEKVYYKGKLINKKQRLKKSSLVMQDVNNQLFSESVDIELKLKNEKTKEETIDKLLNRLNLLSYKTSHPMSLSGGQKQRVAILTSVCDMADFIFFDEPTSGMDYKNMMSISKIIKELKDENRIIFIVSHDTEFLNETTDFVLDVEKECIK